MTSPSASLSSRVKTGWVHACWKAASPPPTAGAALEVITSIKRAGADLILTYHAKEAAALLRDNC